MAPMTFDKYQAKALSTAIYPNVGNDHIYPALGLGGEAGEVLEKLKKARREDRPIDGVFRQEIAEELGDVLWYVAMLAYEFGLDLDEVAQMNVEKLASRKQRGKLHGDGDNR